MSDTNDDLWRGYGLKRSNLADIISALYITEGELNKPLRYSEELHRISRWLRSIADALDALAEEVN